MHPNDSAFITPLLELTPADFAPHRIAKAGGLQKKLSKITGQLVRSWQHSPFFMDLLHLDDSVTPIDTNHLLEIVAKESRDQELHMIPVTGLDRGRAYQSAVASIASTEQKEVCIRIFRTQLQRKTFPTDLQRLLSEIGVVPEHADLIIDYQIADNFSPSFPELYALFPDIERWRTFTIVSGAFPKDLTGFTIGRHLIERRDWLAWLGLVTPEGSLPRTPTFGDYTIQHPIFSEPPRDANFSASIRYTSEQNWLIMRGEGVRHSGSPGFAQWPANAELLCDRAEFCGPDFSYGDEYIDRMSLETQKPREDMRPGNATTWLLAGINHHLTFVVRQIARVFDVSSSDIRPTVVHQR